MIRPRTHESTQRYFRQPLTDLAKKGHPNILNWQNAHQVAFDVIIEVLTSRPVLQMYDPEADIIVQTDASELGIGGVLLQSRDDKLMPVKYVSRKLLDRERSYSIVKKKYLAVLWTVKQLGLHKYLYGRQFTLQTDHMPLVAIGQKKVANERIMRWAVALQAHNMKIKAIKGSHNVIADFVSRFCD